MVCFGWVVVMDVLLIPLDEYVYTPYVYPSSWKETDIERQCLSVFFTLIVGALALYFVVAGFVYVVLFDKEIRQHRFFLKDQEKIEIGYALSAIPWIALYSMPLFVAELRGHSKLYDAIEDRGWEYLAKSIVAFTLWNDFAVYVVHRALHSKLLYVRVHKMHHLFKVHTPFAALAFTPMDGFLQSLPYHLFIFVVPMHKLTYIISFTMVQMWTVFIHDHFFVVPEWLDPFINGSAHHTDHHMYFNYNHGLYFTYMDRLGGTYRTPSAILGNGPIDQIRKEKFANNEVTVESEPAKTKAE